MSQLRILMYVEGISLLVLLFIGMPMKYLAGHGDVVRVVGSLHGILFLAFVAGVVEVALAQGWKRGRIALAIVSSMIPFGFFLLDRTWQRTKIEP